MQVTVLDFPIALPAQCWGCGSPSKEYYIDIDLQIEFYGAFYLCNECFNSVAVKVGYEQPNVVLNTIYLNNKLSEENEDLRTLVDQLLTAIEHLNKAGVNVGLDRSLLRNHPAGIKQLNVVEDTKLDESKPSFRQPELEFGTRETFEPSHDEGVAILRPIKSISNNEFKFSFDE